jgi:hypothetical protein
MHPLGPLEDLALRPKAQFKLRLPDEHKDWVDRKAKASFHSMQAVVLGLIEEAKQKDEQQIKQA